MEKSKHIFFRTKEQELESLNEFKDVFLAYKENKNKANEIISEREKEIKEKEDKIDFYSNPIRYYGDKTDGFDTLRVFSKAMIYVFSFAMLITYFIGVGIFAASVVPKFELKGIIEFIIIVLLFGAQAVTLIVNIILFVALSKKFRVSRKFKRHRSKREACIALLSSDIEKAKNVISEQRAYVKTLDEELSTQKTILHPEDYEHVEYVISLYKSGRAENLKQAILILDNEKRNLRVLEKLEEIEGLIKEYLDKK